MYSNRSESAVLNLIGHISKTETESDAKLLIKSIVEKVGGENFVYSMIRVDRYHGQCDLFRTFEDCSSEWRKIYNERKWFMVDPYIEYARSNTEPALFSQFIPKTKGQISLVATAANHGFQSGIVIPTHSNLGAHEWLGILAVGSSAASALAEPILLSNRVSLRALAMELMDWWKRNLKREAVHRFNIQEQEISILQHLERGRSVLEIAASMDLNRSSVYRRIDSLKDKFRVLKTKETVQKAKFFGLLS